MAILNPPDFSQEAQLWFNIGRSLGQPLGMYMDPEEKRKRGECPCHGSMYNPVTGTAFVGPASLQAPPSNTLARLTLETDADGFLWISPAKWNVNENGVVGYGRLIKS